ncbi:N-acetylmannosamine-6-phosphate 2-epimerase [Biformimicrobium ophioploci]|uniref:N-acylglucosamine-6-phosphate 2-epimerase n=1 Tax=Biformimicrobium ophioploci TaxID=3036711 RepID=A0ABQ6LWK9_9GAMM|nr:putative N-acetylmannosamine-6-phosphate 2-epimerase [Microbulbifer sp. NKW57]GMG86461.1 N-acetylmannosamine-6-phosphate 2-epimerase [Microbulbifer sp. NKW57]
MTDKKTEHANTSQLRAIDTRIRSGLIVSCQPVDHGPMDNDQTVVQLAQAALAGGADGVRIEGAMRVAAVRHTAPQALIIGIVKRDLENSPVRISPLREDVMALAKAGADIIAVDATRRPRPVPVLDLIGMINGYGKIAMADCSCAQDAAAAYAAGAAIIGTTLSGYTGGPVPQEPDYTLLRQLAGTYPRVMAEGRFNTPAQCTRARTLGAWAVTVGTAITRTEVVTGWFSQALGVSAELAPEQAGT